jgi:hypothetical protein
MLVEGWGGGAGRSGDAVIARDRVTRNRKTLSPTPMEGKIAEVYAKLG